MAFTIVLTPEILARNAGALYGVTLGNASMNAYTQLAGLNPDVLLNTVYSNSVGEASTAAVADVLIANLGITGTAATAVAKDYITSQLDAITPAARGAAIDDMLSLFAGLTGDAAFGAAATAWNVKLANAISYSKELGSLDISFSSTAFKLGTGLDSLVGSVNDDTFTAHIIDNSNTLQSGDKIDGGAGNDQLNADIGTSQKFAITPETTSVETVAIRAQAISSDTTDNNTSATNEVQIDAQRMSGVTQWESNNSRADLLIEDVRILDSQITKDITIAMVETDPGHVDYGVYFDQYSLRANTNNSTQLRLQLMDTRSASTGGSPLKDSPYDGIDFYANGTLVQLRSTAIDNAQTYDELKTAFENAVKADPALANLVTVSKGPDFRVFDTKNGVALTGSEIVLTAAVNATITTGNGSGWHAAGVVPADSGLHTNLTNEANVSTDLVTSKIILDDVGRGSTGGDLVVGGLSVGDTSTSKGVQRFEIEVRDNSKLQTINSTNNTLREVTVVNGETSSTSHAYVTTTKDQGDLTVLGSVSNPDATNNVPGAGTPGINVALPGTNAQHNGFGFSDVRLIDASAMTGKINFNAEITDASIAKYLNLKDVQAQPAADNVAFVYNGGGNNDSISVVIDGVVAGSTNSSTGREDFTFAVNGGAGNDNITLDIGAEETLAWYVDQKLNANVSVNGGAGDDTIKTPGWGDVKIDAGAGNDTVYVDNSGVIAATWVVSEANAVPNLADLQAVPANNASTFLYNGKLTVSFSGAQGLGLGGGVTGIDADGISNPFTNGWEVTVDIPTGQNYSVNQLHINQAIKAAINSNDVLNKLLVATDGPGNTLTITSLIDGAFVDNDLIMRVSAKDLTAYSTTEQATILTAYKELTSNSLATIEQAQAAHVASITAKNLVAGMDVTQVLVAGGTISAAQSDNTIDLGAGNDVLVLGTGVNSNDTIVLTGYDLGTKTIVNFNDGTTSVLPDSGIDYLDFASYLTSQASASGSTVSTQRIGTSLNIDATVEANSVSVLTTPAFTTDNTFANLTADKFLAAINSTNTGTANYAGITSGTLDAVTSYTTTTPISLVGGIGKSVVLVENNLNRGEYKAFELTFTGTATNTTSDFSAAKLISVLDFGHEINTATSITSSNTAPAAGTGTLPTATTVTLASSAPVAGVIEGDAIVYTATSSIAAPVGGLSIPFNLGGTAATDGSDYVSSLFPASSITILEGATTGTLTLTTAADGVAEIPAETLTVSLGAGAGYSLGAVSSLTTSINDPGTLPMVTLTSDAPAAGVTEGGAVVYTATSSIVAPAGGLSIPFSLSGTADNTGLDYVSSLFPASSITILEGATTGTLTLTTAADGVAEIPAETLTVSLGAGAGYSLDAASSLTTSINDVAAGSVVPVAASNGAGSFDASTADNTFNVTVGSTYTYNASGFALNDKIAFPAGTAIGVNNTSGTDGVIDVVGSLNGNAVTIHLTGVAAASDGAVFGANSFNTVFGADSLA